MRKILSITLCLVYLLLIAGCGKADKTSSESVPSAEELKPRLSVQKLYSAYMEKITEYEDMHGKLSKPYIAPGSDVYADILQGVAYIDLIDFNKDDTEELVLVYYKPYSDDNPSPYEGELYEGCMFMTVFAAQGEDVVRVFEYKLPASEYRCISSYTLQYGFIDNKVHIFNCMDYSLYMPDVEPNEYQVQGDYNQEFTADCYYGYNGSDFQMVYKESWQGEGPQQIMMFNDEIYTYNSDEPFTSPSKRPLYVQLRLSADKYDDCVSKIAEVKKVLSSGERKDFTSFDAQTKFSSYREIADYLLLKYTENSVRDSDGINEITDDNIVEKNNMVEFRVTYTYFDKAYQEINNPRIDKTSVVGTYIVDLATGTLYESDTDLLNSEYLW